jgi:hypothetical protein
MDGGAAAGWHRHSLPASMIYIDFCLVSCQIILRRSWELLLLLLLFTRPPPPNSQ